MAGAACTELEKEAEDNRAMQTMADGLVRPTVTFWADMTNRCIDENCFFYDTA